MERQDLISIGAAIAIVFFLAIVVKPALTGGSGDGAGTLPALSPWQTRTAPTPPAFSEKAEMIEPAYRWTGIDGGVRTWTFSVPKDLFAFYRDMPRIPYASAWGRYALSDADRPYLEALVEAVAPDRFNSPDTAYYRVMDVIFFVQQIPYAYDNSTMSYREGAFPPAYRSGADYPKYPVETLVDGKGDCEDTSILAAAMLDLMGYDVVLLRYSDHMALGIEMAKFSPFYADYPPKYYDYEGKRYYYVETTNYLQIVRIVEDESDNATATVSPERWGRPWSIGRTSGTSLASVQKEKPEIIPLRYVVRPQYHTIYPAPTLSLEAGE